MTVTETKRQQQKRYFSDQFQNRMKQPRFYSPLKGSQARERAMYKLFTESFRDTSTVVWKSTFVPSEIIYAIGAVPLYIETFSAMAAGVGMCTDMLTASENQGFSRDCCSFLRGVLGASRKDILPKPDALISSSYYCDGDPMIFDIFADEYKSLHHYLHIPFFTEGEDSCDLVADQLEEITRSIARETGSDFSQDKLSETIAISNEACRYFKKAMDLRKHSHSPMLGCEAIDHIGSISQLWGSKSFVRISKLLCEELEERIEKGITAVEDEQHRLLWCHLRPYYNDEIFQYLEVEHNAVVAFEMVNLITWDEMDPQKPFQSLAKKLLSNQSIGPYERMTRWISTMIKEYTIDGIIWMAPWGCRHFNSLSQMVKEGLRKEGNIPFYVLDLECVDKRNYSKEQVRTRLDAFLEVLEDGSEE